MGGKEKSQRCLRIVHVGTTFDIGTVGDMPNGPFVGTVRPKLRNVTLGMKEGGDHNARISPETAQLLQLRHIVSKPLPTIGIISTIGNKSVCIEYHQCFWSVKIESP